MSVALVVIPRRILAILVLVFLASCGLEREEYEAIDAWLSCDECIGDERAAVDSIGEDAVPTLARAVKEGPSPGRREIMRRKFLERYPTPGPGGLSAAAYAAQLEANYVAGYRKRSAIALADIGGNKARDALRDALNDSAGRAYRPDVVRTILTALATTEMSTFGGSVIPSVVAFGDTVTVSEGAGLEWSGDEQIVLEGVPFAPADLIVSRTPASIKFLAVGDVGTYPLGVTSLGPDSVTQIGNVTIRSLVDASDRGKILCPTVACAADSAAAVVAFPYTVFLSLWTTPPRPDTVDLLQFRPFPPETLTVTARLDWPTSANFDLRWRRCMPFGAVVGNETGATTANPESSTVMIPGGECWVLLVSLRPQHPRPEFARLRLTSP